MTPIEILTSVVCLLAFVGYVTCLTRLFWLTVPATVALGYFVSLSFPLVPDNLIYWGAAVGLFITALLVVSFLPKSEGNASRPRLGASRLKASSQKRARRPAIRIKKPSNHKNSQPEIIVDGTNVLFWDGEADLDTLRSVVATLRAKNLLPFVFFDASTRHHLGDKSLNREGFAHALGLANDRIMVCPAKTEADAFILKYAKENHLPVVSNDRFGDRADQAKGLKLIKGVIANGKPILHGF